MTLAQITLAAQSAANSALTANVAGAVADDLGQQTIKLEAFALSGIDRADFSTFESAFNSQIAAIQHLSKQDSPATLAAKKAAQAVPAPAAKIAPAASVLPSTPPTS